jgi:hypothetical protein
MQKFGNGGSLFRSIFKNPAADKSTTRQRKFPEYFYDIEITRLTGITPIAA